MGFGNDPLGSLILKLTQATYSRINQIMNTTKVPSSRNMKLAHNQAREHVLISDLTYKECLAIALRNMSDARKQSKFTKVGLVFTGASKATLETKANMTPTCEIEDSEIGGN